MNSYLPSISAIGAHLDEQLTVDALARRYAAEEGQSEAHDQEPAYHERAEQELYLYGRTTPANSQRRPAPPTAAELWTDQMMVLGR